MDSKIRCHSILNTGLVFLLLLPYCTNLFGQYQGHKNTIRVNVINPIIFGSGAVILGYERTIGRHQSFSADVGSMGMPSFSRVIANDSLQVQKSSGNKGFHFSADYRFYLNKENKYEAPRGVYIGPYYAYNRFSRTNSWSVNTTSFKGNVSTDVSLDVHTIGAQLGYQFVLWKRFSIDLILVAPGVGIYKVKAALGTTLSEANQALLFDRINKYLGDKIPGYHLVIKEGDFTKKGSVSTTTFGYRYVVNIGFRF
jgi:hypothetical protein